MRKNHGSKSDDVRLINIRYKDGRLSRLPRGDAGEIVDSGKAKYVSNTVYRKANRAEGKAESKADNVKKQQQKAAERRKKKGSKTSKDASAASTPSG